MVKRAYQLLVIFSYLSFCTSCQNVKDHPALVQFQVGYPTAKPNALAQLNTYPLPRYLPGNHLLRLFDWMDPAYLAGRGDPKLPRKEMVHNTYLIQKELITNWNYGIVIPNAGEAFGGPQYSLYPVEIVLANEHPEVSLDVITFWNGASPKALGYNLGLPMISNHRFDSAYSITFTRDGAKNKEIKFNFPDTLLRIDGEVQKYYLSKIMKFLKRPINRINENGEEPPGPYVIDYLKDDPATIHMKDSMKIDSWQDFASTRKLQMRKVYTSEFMNELPGLKNTALSFYIVEGGPIDRFKWSIMKKIQTPINGTYYSTPDFYPRWPKNWKDWTGAWHGWQWIAVGRKTEIAEGDYLFSPFVAAGWSKKNDENITPGQWLGLLKSLAVVGAEFYYVGYFNLSAPFNDPSDYIWQAAIPGYAQAITSRFEDVLKNGNVLFNEKKQPIIYYPVNDNHVLITARKANNAEKYVICGTYQPFSNDSAEIPESENVTATINGHTLSFEARRQGSVYIYEKTPDNRTIFYQLDKWHENAHPSHWSKDFYFEAEVADSGINSGNIFTETTGSEGDYTNFTSYITMAKDKETVYHFGVRDSAIQNRFLWIRYKGKGSVVARLHNIGGSTIELHKDVSAPSWQWVKMPIPVTYNCNGNNSLGIKVDKGELSLDKFVISTKADTPPLDK